MTEIPRIVAATIGFQIAILKANTFNLFFAERPGAPPDRETPFRGSVDEVRSRAQIAREIRIGTSPLQASPEFHDSRISGSECR